MADDLGNFVDGYTLALGNETDGRTLALGNSAGDLVDSPITTYYKEVIDEELLAANECVAFHSTWETAGTQAIDVSGKGNHGTYVDSPTLGEDPIAEGFLHSMGGTDGYLDLSTSIDISDDFTIAGFAEPASGFGKGLVRIGGGSNYIGIFQSSGNLRLAENNGTSDSFFAVSQPASAFGWCMRRAGDSLEMWIDGASVGTLDISGQVYAATTAIAIKTWGHVGVGNWGNRVQHHGTFDAALTDAQCARLSEGTV